jgi:uncharacterized protein (TIGR00369 family)
MTTTQNIVELFDLIGYRRLDSSDDEVVMELPVAPHVVNTNGGLQGGLLATLVDAAAGGLAVRRLGAGESVATADLHLRYLRPIVTGSARATARIMHCGKRSMVVEVEIVAMPAGDLAVMATVGFAIIADRSRPV